MLPETRIEIDHRYFFGLVHFYYVMEDRRPDLVTQEEILKLRYKYKHIIQVRILWTRYSLVIRSVSPGYPYINDKEVKWEV